ncbi:MAG: serine hydrolase domain-containing protein [Gaiellaceae bacterium]
MATARARTGVPGVAAGLLRNGAVELAADGVLELGREEPVRPETPFRIASISKPFTAALAAACLPLEGRIVELLSHTAGLRPESSEPLPAAAWRLWSYSNAGYWEAAALCSDASGTAFETALHERVLAPLGLAATGFEEPLSPARGHVQEGETGHRAVPDDAYPRERRASGGLWSTVGDLLRFAAHQLATPSAVFEPRTAALGARYALGWWVRESPGGLVYDHEGSVAGYQSLLLIAPDRGLALAVLTNSWRGSGVARRLVDALALLPAARAVAAARVRELEGRYALDGQQAEVTASGERLLLATAETDPVTGARIAAPRYAVDPLGAGVFGFAHGTLMGGRADFPRPGIGRIGWTALPRVAE